MPGSVNRQHTFLRRAALGLRRPAAPRRTDEGMEAPARSLAKAMSWRLLALIVTLAVAWSVVGEMAVAAAIGVADAAIKIGAFYAHERLWNRIGFGRRPPPDYQI